MTELPESWAVATVGEIATVQLGRQRSPKNHTGPHMRPYLRSANVTWRGIDIADVKEMNFDPDEAATFELRDGDILLNEASGSPGEVGKPAIWRNEIPGACFQNTLLRVRSAEINEDFLYWYFYNAAFTGRFGEAGRGVNIRHLGKQGLASFRMPVPPLPEQRRIVAAIEEHFSRLDASEASLRTALARLNHLSVAPAEAVWDAEEVRRSLAGIGTTVTGSTPSTSDGALWDGSFPFATPGDLDHGGYIATAKRGLSEAGRRAARVVPAGSVLVTCIGATLGKTSLALAPMATNQQINALVVDAAVADAEFVVAMLSCPRGQRALREASSSTTLPILNKSRFGQVEVPLPSLRRQQELFAEIDAITEDGRRLRHGLVVALQRAGSLRRSIFWAAFSGQLVLQDPSDEPASMLLGRIAAEHVATKPTRRKKAAS